MSLTFNYKCWRCGIETTNNEMESFVCQCGGNFRLKDKEIFEMPIFDAYYDPSVDTYLTSYRQMEKVGKNYRSKQHPEGYMIYEDTKFSREKKYIRKHREDYIQEQYKKAGKNYKPGSNTRMNNATGEFVPHRAFA